MTKAEAKLHSDAEKLRAKLAEAQAVVDHLQAKLHRLECKLTGEPPKETGLDMLWKAAPKMARTRSSHVRCRRAWLRIPDHERPKISEVLAAIRAWSNCWDWKKDGGLYVPGLDKWIADRKWENLPEDSSVGSSERRFDGPPRPAAPRVPEAPKQPTTPDEEPATSEDIAAAFAPLLKRFPSTRQ